MSKFKNWGFFTALVAVFVAGTKTGVKYAKGHYVSRDRKFIKGEVVKIKEKK